MMSSIWHYKTPDDYQNIIRKIKNIGLRNKLYNQYISKRPMLKDAYLKLKKKYGEHR